MFTRRLFFLLVPALLASAEVPPMPEAVPADPPAGYVWSEPLVPPPAMSLGVRETWGDLDGTCDFLAAPVGDNWSTAQVGPYVSLAKPNGASVSFRLPCPVDEPSCGYLVFRRGPYLAGTAEAARGPWMPGQPANAGPYPECPMPVFSHHGGDYCLSLFGGHPWRQANFWPYGGDTFWKHGSAVGPLQLDLATRAPLAAASATPVLTLTSAVPNRDYWACSAWLDQFGRETQLSPPVAVPRIPNAAQANCIELRRQFEPPAGAVAWRLYLATDPAGPYSRQRVLAPVGSPACYEWPVHLARVVVHTYDWAIRPNPSFDVRSWLNPVQADVAAGVLRVVDRPGEWKLYCPLVLSYTLEDNTKPSRFGRTVKPCTLTQAGAWPSPAVVVCNQRDAMEGVTVRAATSVAAVASLDYKGGQAFSNRLAGCDLQNDRPDGYALLVEEAASPWAGAHTASEWKITATRLAATRPFRGEGRQTAKFWLADQCELQCSGGSKFPSEVCAVEHFAPTRLVLDELKGIGTRGNDDRPTCRTLFGLYNEEGQPRLSLRNFYSDRGASVAFAFGPNTGGRAEVERGDTIGVYAADRKFFRLLEAPNCRNSALRSRGLATHPAATVLAYTLNHLALDVDQGVAEVVAPDAAEWQARGLYLQANGLRWDQKPSTLTFGLGDAADAAPRRSPVAGPVPVP